MADDLRRQLREVEQALAALEDVIAVRREYVALIERVGSRERELAGLEALADAAARLQAQRDALLTAREHPIMRAADVKDR
jgi:DNA repair exonuclease SbcCD ATPase subunit